MEHTYMCGVEFKVIPTPELYKGGMNCGIPQTGVKFESDEITLEINKSRSILENRNIGIKLLEFYFDVIKNNI